MQEARDMPSATALDHLAAVERQLIERLDKLHAEHARVIAEAGQDHLAEAARLLATIEGVQAALSITWEQQLAAVGEQPLTADHPTPDPAPLHPRPPAPATPMRPQPLPAAPTGPTPEELPTAATVEEQTTAVGGPVDTSPRVRPSPPPLATLADTDRRPVAPEQRPPLAAVIRSRPAERLDAATWGGPEPPSPDRQVLEVEETSRVRTRRLPDREPAWAPPDRGSRARPVPPTARERTRRRTAARA